MKALPGCRIAPHDHTAARAAHQLSLKMRSSNCAAPVGGGQDWIGAELGLPARTISAILRRHQLPYLRDCDPLTGDVIRSSKATAVRYERARPGELIHMDVKKIGRIPDGGGWKAHGRAKSRSAAQRNARIGFDYVHSVVDDHSRLAYSEILPDEKGSDVR